MLFTIGARGGNGGVVNQASHLGLAERVKEGDEDVEVEVGIDGMNEIRAKRMAAAEGMKRRSLEPLSDSDKRGERLEPVRGSKTKFKTSNKRPGR
jgi:hypothetical protein